jgi:hypothetical protein
VKIFVICTYTNENNVNIKFIVIIIIKSVNGESLYQIFRVTSPCLLSQAIFICKERNQNYGFIENGQIEYDRIDQNFPPITQD